MSTLSPPKTTVKKSVATVAPAQKRQPSSSKQQQQQPLGWKQDQMIVIPNTSDVESELSLTSGRAAPPVRTPRASGRSLTRKARTRRSVSQEPRRSSRGVMHSTDLVSQNSNSSATSLLRSLGCVFVSSSGSSEEPEPEARSTKTNTHKAQSPPASSSTKVPTPPVASLSRTSASSVVSARSVSSVLSASSAQALGTPSRRLSARTKRLGTSVCSSTDIEEEEDYFLDDASSLNSSRHNGPRVILPKSSSFQPSPMKQCTTPIMVHHRPMHHTKIPTATAMKHATLAASLASCTTSPSPPRRAASFSVTRRSARGSPKRQRQRQSTKTRTKVPTHISFGTVLVHYHAPTLAPGLFYGTTHGPPFIACGERWRSTRIAQVPLHGLGKSASTLKSRPQALTAAQRCEWLQKAGLSLEEISMATRTVTHHHKGKGASSSLVVDHGELQKTPLQSLRRSPSPTSRLATKQRRQAPPKPKSSPSPPPMGVERTSKATTITTSTKSPPKPTAKVLSNTTFSATSTSMPTSVKQKKSDNTHFSLVQI